MLMRQLYRMERQASKLFKLLLFACILVLAFFAWFSHLLPRPASVLRVPWPSQAVHNVGNASHKLPADVDGQGNTTSRNPSQTKPDKLAQDTFLLLPYSKNECRDVSNTRLNQGKAASDSRKLSQASSSNGSEAVQGVGPCEEVLTGYNGSILQETPPRQGSRFLIFECVEGSGLCGGWADRQEGLVTVFLLAYLTHRRFGIRMTTPCEVSKFVLPNHYNWIVPDTELRGKSTRRIHAIDRTQFSREMPTMDFNAKFPEDVVFLRTNRDLLKDITTNPHYRDVLPPWARQARPEFFRDVWRTLMKPSPEVEQRLGTFLGSLNYANRSRPLLGVHVRTGGSKYFADGALGDKLKRIDMLWDFAQPYVENGSALFVATDNPDVLKSSVARFGSRHHDTQAVLRHVDRQRSDPAICQALGGAILDQLVLTRCDVLVVSPGSGYSSRAAMMRGTNRQLFEFAKSSISPADMYKMCDPIC